MDRKDELIVLMKSLLGKLKDSIDNNQFSSNVSKVIDSSEECVETTKQLEKYLDEYKNLQ